MVLLRFSMILTVVAWPYMVKSMPYDEFEIHSAARPFDCDGIVADLERDVRESDGPVSYPDQISWLLDDIDGIFGPYLNEIKDKCTVSLHMSNDGGKTSSMVPGMPRELLHGMRRSNSHEDRASAHTLNMRELNGHIKQGTHHDDRCLTEMSKEASIKNEWRTKWAKSNSEGLLSHCKAASFDFTSRLMRHERELSQHCTECREVDVEPKSAHNDVNDLLDQLENSAIDSPKDAVAENWTDAADVFCQIYSASKLWETERALRAQTKPNYVYIEVAWEIYDADKANKIASNNCVEKVRSFMADDNYDAKAETKSIKEQMEGWIRGMSSLWHKLDVINYFFHRYAHIIVAHRMFTNKNEE